MSRTASFRVILLTVLYKALIIYSRNVSECPEKIGKNTPENKIAVDSDNLQCSIYLAPSSLSNGGMGVFTTRTIRSGEVILQSDGPNIPVIDPFVPTFMKDDWISLFQSYWWAQLGGLSDQMKFEADEVADYQVTFGALPNFHTYLHNFGFRFPDDVYDDSTMAMNNPGRGAYSYHTGRLFYAYRDINAGEEFFLDYGEHYFEGRSYLDHVPRSRDFEVATEVLQDLTKEFDLLNWTVWNVQSMDTFNIALSAARTAVTKLNQRIASILPKSMEEVRLIYDTATKLSLSSSFTSETLSLAIAKEMSVSKRSVEEIVQNGHCLDNIIPGESGVLYAGKGAFARRYIAAGSVIVPVPMLHIINRDVLRFVNTDKRDTSPYYPKMDSYQLLINYCFGHSLSSVLLCPTTNMILMNHHQSPNAYIRWATWDEKSEGWRTMPLSVLAKQAGRGLTLEVVALRNIDPGEEIFINYGDGWEEAWQEHVQEWIRRDDITSQVPASVLNKAAEQSSIHNSSIPPNYFTACLYADEPIPQIETYLDIEDWHALEDDALVDVFGLNGERFSINNNLYRHASYWPCSVVPTDASTYSVRIFQHPKLPRARWDELGIPRILTNFPTQSIKLFIKPYESDIHLSGAFRHHIGIPDHIFPPEWRNRCVEEDHTSERTFVVGDVVQANWKNSGEWFDGIVSRLCQNGLYEITYTDGEIEKEMASGSIRIRPSRILGSKVHPLSRTADVN